MPYYVDASGNLAFRAGSTGGPGGLYALGRGVDLGVGVAGPSSAGLTTVPAPSSVPLAGRSTIGSTAGIPAPQLGGMFAPFPTGSTGDFVPRILGPSPVVPDAPGAPRETPAGPGVPIVLRPRGRGVAVPPAPNATSSGLPSGVPTRWSPPEADMPAFLAPAGSVTPGLREPFGAAGPVRPHDFGFGTTLFDRSWESPPVLGGLYAGLAWSPERFVYEPGPTLPLDHWYRTVVRDGVYVQAYQADDSPGQWRYRYVRVPTSTPELGRPYVVVGDVEGLYAEKDIADRARSDREAFARAKEFAKHDNSLLARMRRGEAVVERDIPVPEKFKRMEVKPEAKLLPMPFWSAISKASVERMYKDAGLVPPELPGEIAAANNAAFQSFKEVRGHDQKSDPFFFGAEAQWDLEEELRRERLKAKREKEAQDAKDRAARVFGGVREPVGAALMAL